MPFFSESDVIIQFSNYIVCMYAFCTSACSSLFGTLQIPDDADDDDDDDGTPCACDNAVIGCC